MRLGVGAGRVPQADSAAESLLKGRRMGTEAVEYERDSATASIGNRYVVGAGKS